MNCMCARPAATTGTGSRRHCGATKARSPLAASEKHVQFVETTDPQTQDAIDEGYRAKYGRYGDSYLGPMVAESARATTFSLFRPQTNRDPRFVNEHSGARSPAFARRSNRPHSSRGASSA